MFVVLPADDTWSNQTPPQPVGLSQVRLAEIQPLGRAQSSPAHSSASSISWSDHSDGTITPDTPVRRPSAQENYIPLDECFSNPDLPKRSSTEKVTSRRAGSLGGGSPLDQVPPAPKRHNSHRGSVDSIPEMPAPPPPIKTGQPPVWTQQEIIDPLQTYDHPSKSYVNIDAEMDLDDGTYKVPPRRHRNSVQDEPLYKVPPTQHLEFVPKTEPYYQVPPGHNYPVEGYYQPDAEYDVPPLAKYLPRREGSQRDSNSSSGSRSSQKQDSAYGSEEFYSVPPCRRNTDSQSMEVLSDKMRTTGLISVLNDDKYDVPPRKAQSETNILDSVPPPPRPPKGGVTPTGAPLQGPYMNVPPNSKSHPQTETPQRATQTVDQMYDFPTKKPSDAAMLSMSPPPPQPCSSIKMHGYVNAPSKYMTNTTESMYMPMAGGDVQEMYMMMQGGGGVRESLYTDMSGVHGIYTAPPSNKPINRAASYSAKPGTVPPKLTRLGAISPLSLGEPGTLPKF